MIAYKGFNKDLKCTMGKGQFQYKVGETYKEDKAQCASTGFHCVEEPIEVLSWYSSPNSRYCMVEASGDIHEDGCNKISCTEMTILKELTIEHIAALECEWLSCHPYRQYSHHVNRNTGEASKNNIVIVRGKNPKAAGELGSTIFLLKEDKRTNEIIEAGAYKINGDKYKPGTYYLVDGRKARCVRKN